MTVLNYINNQRKSIRDRHEGELFVYFACGAVVQAECEAPAARSGRARSAEEILAELDGLKGLNKRERAAYSRRRTFESVGA